MSNFTELKRSVYQANMLLPKYQLVIHTWGNISQKSVCGNYFAIKPSGVSYQQMSLDDIVVLDMQGKIVEGKLKPSSDTPSHLVLYKAFPKIKAIAHTHSPYAVAWASTGQDIPCYSTTHADNFVGNIVCTRELSFQEVKKDYETYTGHVIVEAYNQKHLNYQLNNAILVKSHGPFLWSLKSAKDVANLALTLEQIAKMAYLSKTLFTKQTSLVGYIQEKHYNRKHGKNKYYGQD